MRQLALDSRRPSLKLSAVLLGAGAVVALLAACAQSPVDDDLGGPTSTTNKAEPEDNSARLPPSNPPAPQTDAGSDAKAPTKDAGTTQQKDASTTPPPDAGNTGTGGSCDPNNATYLVKALAEVNKTTPRTCGLMGGSCKASECCFDVYGVCVDL